MRTNANVRDALEKAVFDGARLDGASLDGASLDGASLVGASLVGARLVGAIGITYEQFIKANLKSIKADFWEVLFSVPAEVSGLRKALVEGRVNGSQYQGECACLVGTVANLRHCAHTAIPELKPDSSRPAEVWFLAIREKQTPENCPICRITVEWVDEWREKILVAAKVINAK